MDIEAVRQRVEAARRVTVVAGAGVSAAGAFTVEINPETTGALVDVAIAAPAEAVLPFLEAPQR